MTEVEQQSNQVSKTVERIDVRTVFDEYMPKIGETLERWVPRTLDETKLLAIAGPQRYGCDIDALNKSITGPIWDLLDRGGKRWRSTLLLLVAEALGKKAEDVIDFVVVTEIVHNGSLVIDDIEDNSDYRRGKPCLHKLTGLDVAINAGNAMYFFPLRVLRDRRSQLPAEVLLECYEVYCSEMLNLHLGQGLDISWHSTLLNEGKEPTVDNYLQMCANKTGGLARMSAKLSALICGGTPEQVEAIGRFAESIGIAFQIQDDILNLQSDASLALSKGGAGEDIHEGKRTIMVIHCFNTAPSEQAHRLKQILSMHTSDPVLIAEAIKIINDNHSIEYAHQKAKQLITDAWEGVNMLLPESKAKRKLRALVDFLIEREN